MRPAITFLNIQLSNSRVLWKTMLLFDYFKYNVVYKNCKIKYFEYNKNIIKSDACCEACRVSECVTIEQRE